MTVVQADGRAVTVLRAGAGPALLYLHGLADVHALLPGTETTPLLEALARTRDVVAPALPGCEGSDPLGPRPDIEDHAFHLVDVLDRLGLDTVDLVGVSLGGWVAAELALRHPARVRRMVLVAPLGLHVPQHPGEKLFGAAAPRGVGGFGEVRSVLFAEPEGEIALAALPDEPDRERVLRWFTGLTCAASLGWTGPQLSSRKLGGRLRRIAAPTLLVWGTSDRLVPIDHAERWKAGLADAALEIVDGAAHAVVLEQPDAVATASLSFLS